MKYLMKGKVQLTHTYAFLTQWKINCNNRYFKMIFIIWHPLSPSLPPHSCIRPGRQAITRCTSVHCRIRLLNQWFWQDTSHLLCPSSRPTGNATERLGERGG
jgi:hypothetical protein